MIAAALLAASLLQPVGKITWWRTEGAEAIQEADQRMRVPSLYPNGGRCRLHVGQGGTYWHCIFQR
jgi:hypothetical protein